METFLQIADEVTDALSGGTPVVALESTVIAHGLPHPSNLETALALEKIIRDAGGIPATIAVLKGKICVGLTADQIAYLATGEGILKLGARDLPAAMAQKADGATTVSATAY
ncbi:MAG TPA: pseudouridine-5'-phosphate glycosidase, partial [Armatimonadota bacterium]|nr:pseudouridine-5'-phosphate glycosidase [Armatimonadota bacterium]